MALKQKNILVALLFVMAVSISFAVSFKVSLQNSISPNAPLSNPKAGSCTEECPGSDGIMRSCNPPDSNGDPSESFCSGRGRIEACGGKNYCCPSANGDWTTDMTACQTCSVSVPTSLAVQKISPTSVKITWSGSSCGVFRVWVGTSQNVTTYCSSGGTASTCPVNDSKTTAKELVVTNLNPSTLYYYRIMNWLKDGVDSSSQTLSFTTDPTTSCTPTTWTPNANTVCTGTNLTQTSNCGTTQTVAGTKVSSVWTPNANTVCTGTNLTQTGDCGDTKTVAGIKTDGTCASCTPTTWTPNANTVCTGTNLTQTSNCGTTQTVAGTKVSSVWTPNANTVCTGTNLTQTGDCGDTKTVAGTKYCCSDATWSPSPENTCSESKLVQKSNCGNEREVDGTKICYPNISVVTGAYADDNRNKPGVYFTDKKITKVSRDQFYVYTMEVYNTGDASIKDFVVSDTLTGQNQSLISFIDGEDKCSYDSPTKKLNCKVDKLAPKSEVKLRFRVKTAATALNGKVIRNKVSVNYGTSTKTATVDTLVSSIVSCNEFCNNDSECVAGLACDVFSNKCRKPSCLKSDSCNCALPTATVTATITSARLTATPTDSVVDFPDSSTAVSSPTTRATLAQTADTIEELPSTGIFDLPQTTIFGGGILLAILGIFLAL